jgi:putative oxidoreductase
MHPFEKLKPMALLLLRWALGVIFVYHGWPKLFGKTEAFMASFEGMGLPAWTVYVAGIIELFGGGLLVAGFYTRLAALMLTLHMCVAMWKFNLAEGVLALREYEFPLSLLAGAFALAATGAGAISLDRVIFKDKA